MTDTLMIQRIERLERKIDILIREKENAHHWVSVHILGETTGWTPAEITKYRRAGLVKYRRRNGKIEYNLESVPEQLKKTA